MLTYADVQIASIRRSRPTEDWHWSIIARDYQTEFSWVRLAFMGRFGETVPMLPEKAPKVLFVLRGNFVTESGQFIIVTERGETWEEIDYGARRIAAAIAKQFDDHARPLPYVNTLWST